MKRRKARSGEGASSAAQVVSKARVPERIRYDGEAESGPSIWTDGAMDRPVDPIAGREERLDAKHRPSEFALTCCAPSRPLHRSSPSPSGQSRFLASFLAASLLPLVLSAPAPLPTSRFYRSRPTSRAVSDAPADGVQYITSALTPTMLPTATKAVAETALPYYLTQDENGRWHKVDEAWNLYGRRAANSAQSSSASPSASTLTYQVEDNLPPGWGQVSERTSFYRVPLIVAASVILAVLLTVVIIFGVFQRRKASRKAKRRAERRRRKALAAAGITEGAAPGAAQEAAFKEKLAELEKQHRAKKQKGPGSTFVKTKVKRWNAAVGLRRRRGKGDDPGTPNGGLEGIVEEKAVDVPGVQPTLALRRNSTATLASTHSRERSSGEASGSTTANAESSPSFGESSGSTSESSPADTTSSGPSAPTGSGAPGAPSFPPAYRPASVRSFQLGPAASSSRPQGATSASAAESEAAVVTAQEKVRAPGYYPAPATEESEAAIAVASRRDGKRPVPPPPEEDMDEEQQARMRHIATDDKRVLEQMRMGASAPPIADQVSPEPARAGAQDASGPSAPVAEVDEAGFERFDPTRVDQSEALSAPSAVSPQTRLHPDLPLPPSTTRPHSFMVHSSEPTSEAHLLPSAPPASSSKDLTPSAPALPSAEESAAPSAPVFDVGDDEDDLYEDGATIPTPVPDPPAASAPPLPSHEDESDDVDEHPAGVERDDTRLAQLTGGEVPVQPRLLPRYEP